MTTDTNARQERINIRLRQSAKQMIERAASFEGKTVSNFVLSSAVARAEKTIHDHEVMTLNARDSEAFFNALAKPMRFNDALTKALDEHEQRIISK